MYILSSNKCFLASTTEIIQSFKHLFPVLPNKFIKNTQRGKNVIENIGDLYLPTSPNYRHYPLKFKSSSCRLLGSLAVSLGKHQVFSNQHAQYDTLNLVVNNRREH